MQSRQLATFLAPLALLTAPTAGAAVGARPSCADVVVESDVPFRARWPSLLESVRDELAARDHLDTCARVELSAEDDAIGVAVTLPDGRAASRRVTRSVDVVPTLEALLLVPEYAPVEPTPSVTPPPRSRAPRPRLDAGELRVERANDRVGPSAWSPGAGPRRLGFELSMLAGARVGDGQVGIGGGVLSFLEAHGWLVGFEGRVDRYETIHGSDPETGLALAALGGRRFHFDSVALDLTAGPALAMKGIAFSETQTVRVVSDDTMGSATGEPSPSSPPPPPREASTGPLPRLLLGARLGFSPRSTFRTFVGIDGEVGPTRSSDAAADDSARLPAFAVGLAVGATLGTP